MFAANRAWGGRVAMATAAATMMAAKSSLIKGNKRIRLVLLPRRAKLAGLWAAKTLLQGKCPSVPRGNFALK
ncbi:hypothetical protein NBRC116596_14190 [Litorivita sp. NS0012-18]